MRGRTDAGVVCTKKLITDLPAHVQADQSEKGIAMAEARARRARVKTGKSRLHQGGDRAAGHDDSILESGNRRAKSFKKILSVASTLV